MKSNIPKYNIAIFINALFLIETKTSSKYMSSLRMLFVEWETSVTAIVTIMGTYSL